MSLGQTGARGTSYAPGSLNIEMASAAHASSDTALRIEICCDRCQRKPNPCHVIDVFIEMKPKADTDIPFYLCVGCWLADDWSPDSRAQSRMIEIRPSAQVVIAPP